MSSSRAWLPLPLPSSSELPVLLVSLNFGTAEYTLHVTDLANVWTESLDRKAICMRGWSENTTIDPSDTPENMSKFLTSLRSALDPSQPAHDETSLSLLRASKSDAGDDGLTLKITCQLPGLPALKWPMHLKKSPPSAIAADLVLPLIEAHLTRHQEVESLIRLLAQKDAVMTKLLDKLEAVGTGLEHVFNPLSGRKKVSRTAAAEKVPGLAPFNRRRWKTGIEEDDDGGPNTTESLIKEVFGGEGMQYHTNLQIDSSPGLDKWWRDFAGVSQKSGRPRAESPAKEETPLPSDQAKDDNDDDFQVQSTPPHLQSTREPADAKMKDVPDDASTADEDESPQPPKRKSPEAKKPASRLGALGRKKKSPPPRSPSPVPLPSRKKAPSPPADDSETASEGGDDGAPASPADDEEPPAPSPPPKPAPRKGGLGRIGGSKSKPPEKQKTPEAEVGETGSQSAKAASTTPHKKLGVIGKKKADDGAAPDETPGRGRGASRQQEEEAKPRETSQERADRKRAELKRDLEKKAAAGPAKKKRKF